ncbi:MAG: class I tRNA ligase family protein [Candidatus Bathyarchaeota archaeon]|nr:class I tRNA ligase family protein [Candidatus Bathyarchaeota archaeon]
MTQKKTLKRSQGLQGREKLLNLYNTLTRKMEPFQATENKTVKMYTCGPSTYQHPHIGNYRTFLFEDVLQRYLEYLGYSVERLITLTNIEDKAIDRAETANISVDELTNRNEAIFFEEFEQLRIKRPQYSVRASTIVDQAEALINALLQRGVAYRYTHNGAQNVYYDPLKFKDFGKLAHLDMKKWPKKKRRFHLDTYSGTPWNMGDFILWHGCKERDKVCWENSLGRGRPAWNVQDAAMVTKHLGFSIDVVCGGIDNLVRHHDYTLAVAEAVSGKPFARYWLHGRHLYVNGQKMAKSKRNVLYLNDLTDEGYTPADVRFFLIYDTYRENQNFTGQNLTETSKKLHNIKRLIRNLKETKTVASSSTSEAEKTAKMLLPTFEKYMDDNLDVKNAFDALCTLVAKLDEFRMEKKLGTKELDVAVFDLKKIDAVLQVLF